MPGDASAMLKQFKTIVFGGLLALSPFFAGQAAAQSQGTVIYTVQRNDTLYGIADRYLVSSESARQVQRFNRVRNPRHLSINRRLRIPRNLLRHEPVQLIVSSFSGPVTIGGEAPATDMILNENDIVMTGPNGFIRFSSGFGGRITLPSNTTAQLIRARRYILGNTLDVDFSVTRGRATASSPTLEGQDRVRMRTPVAVTAVRGTEFRVAYDPENGDNSLTEVTEGAVQVAAGGQERAAPAGFGVSSSAAGVSEPEALLPSPQFLDRGAVQTDELLNFSFEPVVGAKGYRVQLGRDAGLLDIVSEQVVNTEAATMQSIENGRYYVRVRSISESGLEGGNSDSDSFLRKQLGVVALAGASPDYDSFNFSWTPSGGESATFAFQIWLQDTPETLLVDEVGLTATKIALTNLSAGKYEWRVAVTETDPEEGLIKVWGEAQTLTVSQ